MIHRFQNGGEVALNQQENVRREPPKSAIPIKGSTASVPQPLKPYVPSMEKLKKIISKMKDPTRSNYPFGKFLITKEGTIVVENGGKIA